MEIPSTAEQGPRGTHCRSSYTHEKRWHMIARILQNRTALDQVGREAGAGVVIRSFLQFYKVTVETPKRAPVHSSIGARTVTKYAFS